MTLKHQFQDEWLLQAVAKRLEVSAETVEDFRNQRKPYLSEALVEAGKITPAALGEAVKAAYNFDYVEPSGESIDKLALSLVPEKSARSCQLVPLRLQDESIEVAMANPLNTDALMDVSLITGRSAIPRYCLPGRLNALMDELYSPDVVVVDLLKQVQDIDTVEVLKEPEADLEKYTTDDIRAPVIRLVNAVIAKAVGMGASDIHIEHEERSSMVRYRVDGTLRNIMALPHDVAVGPLVSRIKIMSNLNLAEHRRPQDGRAKLRVGSAEFGLRVSILPTHNGEKVVLRILDRRTAEVPFEKLGFKSEPAARLEALIQSNQGIILVTGPTGSGKTTTLYSIINKLRSEDTNIITIEDPIEYKIEGITQVQINEKQGLTFPTVLRSVLRQDPDIILVGEVRDRETAEIAFQSALTGHLVLTTLHTNDTLSTITRLEDLGLERYKIAPGLLALTAQRLVRRLCPDCKGLIPPSQQDPAVIAALKRHNLPGEYFKAVGCANCYFTGYRGRLPILEFLEISPELREAISGGEGSAALGRLALQRAWMHALLDDALWHLSCGDTTVDEILPHVNIIPPATPEAAPPQPPEAVAVAGNAGLKVPPAPPRSRRILIVDDDDEIRGILRNLLVGQGYKIEEVSDGLAALEYIGRNHLEYGGMNDPELLLCDLNMPNVDGWAVIRAIRQDLGMLTLPIIVLSANADDRTQEETLRMGADDYIVKPFKTALVLARINAAFRRLEH